MKLLNRRLALISTVTGITLLTASAAAFADSHKVLTKEIAVENISKLVLDAHVGSVKISESDDNLIHIYVKVSEKDGWSLFKGDPENAALKIEQRGQRITVSLNDDEYGEEWKLEIPQLKQVDADLGIGEMIIRDISTNLSVDVGVGDVNIYSAAQDFSSAKAETSVGGAAVHSDVGHVSQNRSMVSEEVSWIGQGKYAIHVEVGVGEASIKLN